MEEDGLLLNISRSEPKPVLKKKSKATAKRPVVKQAPVKQTVTETHHEPTESAPTGPAPGTKMLHGRAQIVSSLFSSNPNIPTLLKKSVQKGNQEASNAALVDSSTFTGIGLTADLSAHLANKLQVTAPTNVQAKAIPVLLGPSARVRQTAINTTQADVDVVVQAQTGSGKTLTYLLPIVNRLIEASTASKNSSTPPFGDRAVGTVAIVLTPTRELAQQVLGVLTQLLNLPRPQDENVRRQHWIVPGIVIGGDSKPKEKARLRKGINVLVSTPGRLLDHLENTKSFDIRNLKWLVLDEADRLLDLGFEETLKKIMQLIDDRTRQGCLPKYRDMMANRLWPSKRQTVLCSATLRDDVKELAGWSLVNPAFISGTEIKTDALGEETKFTTPNQLKQTYTLVPAKLRLITLLALIRSYFFNKQSRKQTNSKVIVFFSCCDSVDFHYDLFSNAGKPILDSDDSDDELTQKTSKKKKSETEMMKKALDSVVGKKRFKPQKDIGPVSQISSLLSDKPVFRLHGELGQQTRSDTFAQFTKASSGVLFCTDVAARGLDLPNVDRIIQYDVPTDLKDYVHRAGRTARIGRVGEATLFLLPSEMEYVDILKAQDLHLEQIAMETILKNIAEVKDDYQTPAQHLQNTMESYAVSTEERVVMARKAFWSTVRAYATHPATEKHIFHVKKLHLGHLAKSFALREAPSNIMENVKGKNSKKKERVRPEKKTSGVRKPRNTNVAIKRGYDNSSEFAIASASSMKDGPTTKKRKKN